MDYKSDQYENKDLHNNSIWEYAVAFVMGMVMLGALIALIRGKVYEIDLSTDTGDVLNIYTYTTEFQELMIDYYPDYEEIDGETGRIGDVTVKWIIVPNVDGYYKETLKEVLDKQDIDIFIVEPCYNSMDFINDADCCLTMEELELTPYMRNQYPYTIDVAMDADGRVKGSAWAANPGAFMYRRSAAREVFGTDNPEEVQQYLKDWESFYQSAEELDKNGWKIVGASEETYRIFSQNAKNPWVENGKIQIDPSLMEWSEQAKNFYEKGYVYTSGMWSMEWMEGGKEDGDVFGYFAAPWFVEAIFMETEMGECGDWAICEGPENFFWGGHLLCVAKESDNPGLARDILYQLTCNAKIMREMAEDGEFVNNFKVMDRYAEVEEAVAEYMGGQDVLEIFCQSAKKLHVKPCTPYDNTLDSLFQENMKLYFDGVCSEEEALEKFYNEAKEVFPELEQ